MGKKAEGRRSGIIFFIAKARKNKVLTPSTILDVQKLYADGDDLCTISHKLSIKEDTLKKAVRKGNIVLIRSQEKEEKANLLVKSERSALDDIQVFGKACSNVVERILSIKTGMPCSIDFGNHVDLSHAGVLFSLPALLSNGLLRYEHDFYPDQGYYSIASVFISLSFLCLLRAKTLSQSSQIPSGELGKIIGLDRIPEVKTLRKRIESFCEKCNVELWANKLSNDWMEAYPELSGILYIDGHVNIYYGNTTQMPKRYVSRLRLCMSGSTDYWVNDHLGQPFFVVNKTINSGMIQTIKEDIMPRIDKQIPNQPDERALKTNAMLHRYMLIFDRECYSPDFFYDLWHGQRVAICTYNKNVKDKWPDEEFNKYIETLATGQEQETELAERGVLLHASGSKKAIWAREIRKKTKNGHQTSIITTNYTLELVLIGLYMFARWSQENFFKYMMENFGIDTLVSYCKKKISDTTILINPAYRELENQLKKITSKLNYRKAKFAGMELGEIPIDEKKANKFLVKKSELREEIAELENEAQEIKSKKKQISRKIRFAELPENEKFDSVINQRKSFMNTIKMIAYRAETAMANIIKKHMSHTNEARKILQQIYKSDANLWVDKDNNKLIVELHKLSYWKDDKIVQKLCDELNLSEAIFPGSDLTIFYKMVSMDNP